MSDRTEAGDAAAPADLAADDAPEPAASPGHRESPSAGEEEVVTFEQLLAALEAVTGERDQHLADLQRVSADFANFRKQTERRHAETVAQAGSRLAQALLPVLDACDAAAQQGVEGIDHVADQLKHVLEQEGLEIIADESHPFDPNRHEAAMSEPGDDDQTEPIVAEVLRTGYAWNGRVLRAAMVKVKG